ncbi:MAG: hypothetical protein BWY16_00953 [Candidatus Omnitrophica bacterium ADurb.Bin205]|nr:MAG: hypothetical protein BWY16_00953 [Candidatus Omnitrophica bacterium ADurb.Bin205]
MCPYLLELKTQTVCSCHPEGAFCPSEELMKKSCLGNFKDCSYFKAKTSRGEPEAPTDNSFGNKE